MLTPKHISSELCCNISNLTQYQITKTNIDY